MQGRKKAFNPNNYKSYGFSTDSGSIQGFSTDSGSIQGLSLFILDFRRYRDMYVGISKETSTTLDMDKVDHFYSTFFVFTKSF